LDEKEEKIKVLAQKIL